MHTVPLFVALVALAALPLITSPAQDDLAIAQEFALRLSITKDSLSWAAHAHDRFLNAKNTTERITTLVALAQHYHSSDQQIAQFNHFLTKNNPALTAQGVPALDLQSRLYSWQQSQRSFLATHEPFAQEILTRGTQKERQLARHYLNLVIPLEATPTPIEALIAPEFQEQKEKIKLEP